MRELIHKMISRVTEFDGDYYALYNLKNIGNKKVRAYIIERDVDLKIFTDLGVLKIHVDAGFRFDGRSGPRLIDWYAPNLGNIYERLAWFSHDVNGYASCLDFKSTNNLLKIWLRDMADYSKFKSWTIEKAVSIDKSWFGVPDENDKWRCNLGKYKVEWL